MIAGYTLGRKIGEGTFGAVYEASLPGGPPLALKLSLRPLTDASTKEAMLMQNEIEAMQRLEHPSVVRVHDAGFTSDGLVYIAMELVDGEPLDRYLDQRKSLDAIEAIRITAAIADAVAVCHELDILHLDLKPHNVVLADPHRPAIKVLDFGLAHATGAWQAGGEASGTPYYMSPERFEAAMPDVRDDLYALGVILYELLTGEPPFSGENLNQIYASKCSSDYVPASEINSGVSVQADALIAALLRPARANRPSSARKLADELDELAFQTLAGFSHIAQSRPLELSSVASQNAMVGRRAELGRLLETSRGRTGRGAGVVLIGEPGVGKSRLVAQFLDELARSSDLIVGYGRCRELSNVLPFSPWREAIGRLAEAMPDVVNVLAPTLASVAGLLARLVPELGAGPTSVIQADSDAMSVEAAVTLLLKTVGAVTPCVIAIDDLHWADAGSRALLDHIAAVGVPAGITLVVTSRSATDARPGFQFVELGPLDRQDSDALIGEALGSSQPDVVSRVKRHVPLLQTGNPLVTIQVLRHLEAARCLVRSGGRLIIDEQRMRSYQPPACVRGVISASLSELTDTTRNVLAVGALLGRTFRCDDLYDIGVFDCDEVRDAFCEALAAQVLSRSSCGQAAIFVHDTIREQLAASIESERIRHLHARIAEVLAVREASSAELAHHYDLAQDHENAARAHLDAGRNARALQAPIDAATHLERAAANALRCQTSTARDRLLCSATFELVAASSQLGSTEETLAHLDRCSDAISERTRETRIALEAGYARALYVRGDFSQAAKHGESCLALAGNDENFSSYTLIPLALAGRAKTASGRFGPAADVLATVAELAAAQGEWVELAHSTGVRGISLAYRGSFRKAHDCVDRSLEIAHQLGDPIRMLAGLFYRTVIAEAAFDLELGLAASTHALRYAAERDIGGIYNYLSTLFAGRQQFHAGELERAKVLLTRALDKGGQLDISMGRGWNFAFLGDVFFALKELAAAQRCYESAIHLGRTGAGDEYAGPVGMIGLAHCLARIGGSDRQIDEIARAALARLAAVENWSVAASTRDRLAAIWEERGRIDRATSADAEARTAFLALRVNRRAWCPDVLRDTPYRRRRSPSRHPTLIGPAGAPHHGADVAHDYRA